MVENSAAGQDAGRAGAAPTTRRRRSAGRRGLPRLATTNLALCQQPAATVATAPTTHTITTTKPVPGWDDSATTPATVNIAAAASWVGATARRTCRTMSPEPRAGQRPPAERGGRGGGAQATHRREEHAAHLKRHRPRRASGAPSQARLPPEQAAVGVAPGALTRNPLVMASVAARRGDRLLDSGGDRQRHQVLVRARGRDGVPARRVERHVVVAVGALDQWPTACRRSRPATHWWCATRSAAGSRCSRG